MLMKIKTRVSTVVFMVAAVLVLLGYRLQEWALANNSQIWINLSPDIMGAGLLVFVAGIVLWLIGQTKGIKKL